MTPLARRLVARIRREGPIPLAEYMTECLLHPEHGYYTTRDPLGQSGDFTTAPEISQVFGELVGLWLAQTWIDQGAPGRIILAELGPGRGTLMADILRATAVVPGFSEALELHLVEASPALRARQLDTISHSHVTFHDHLADVPEGPLFLVANEFFDALPLRQFQRGAVGWRERQVGVSDGRLAWGLSPEGHVPDLADRLDGTEPGQIVEHCGAALALAAEIGRRIAAEGGAALIVDYGDRTSIGDTFQAVEAHEHTDPLARPGMADLTAHVAFGPIATAAAPARAWGPLPQGLFLERLGITARARALARGLTGPALEEHVAAHRRLTHPEEMGNLFKVLAIAPPGAPQPPGMEPA